MIHAEGVLKLLIIITELAMILRGEFFYKMLPKCLFSSRLGKNQKVNKYGCLQRHEHKTGL